MSVVPSRVPSQQNRRSIHLVSSVLQRSGIVLFLSPPLVSSDSHPSTLSLELIFIGNSILDPVVVPHLICNRKNDPSNDGTS
ncbi:hypothetical protein F2P81_023611 [Scophthalmus maximus]|uniref:Uncharacterized protein n=1 Tax=Scophthalmus maximus TaxID=52904 RepID=A0A6A4RWW5_SCOMX|nr:hypothetical protein F2P81_023611 [Scophthalmus maximus]